MSLGIDTRLLGRVLDAVLAAVHNRPNKAEEEHSENYAKNNRPEDVTIHYLGRSVTEWSTAQPSCLQPGQTDWG